MSNQDDSAEKQHEPTQKKLDDARRKGEVPKSTDLNTAAAYGGMLLALLAIGYSSVAQLVGTLAALFANADTLSRDWFRDLGQAYSAELALSTGKAVFGWFIVPAIAVLAAIIAQRSFVVAPDKLIPKLNRISLISNAKNKFGRSGLFEFFKSFTKLCVYSLILGVFLFWRLDEIIAVLQLDPAGVLIVLAETSLQFLAIVFVIAASIGGIDFLWQRQEHMRKNRMSRKELTDETKQSEGDPHMKQQRRQRGYDIAMNKMLADVPEADVIIVNPTHYAIALKWSRAPGSAPECVAKGVDEVAAKIREIASESAIPIHHDPPTARLLFSSVEIGEEIRPEQYEAVAAAIRFAEKMRAKARVSF